jgi:hypothetical protein
MNARCRKSSAGKSLNTTFDKKRQWLVTFDGSSRDKSELEMTSKRLISILIFIRVYFSRLTRTVRSDCVSSINGKIFIVWHWESREFSRHQSKFNKSLLYNRDYRHVCSIVDTNRRTYVEDSISIWLIPWECLVCSMDSLMFVMQNSMYRVDDTMNPSAVHELD